MSESASRKPIDFDEFERRLRGLVPPTSGAPEDRMAELARIVGRQSDRVDPSFRPLRRPDEAAVPSAPAAREEDWTEAPEFSPLRGSFDAAKEPNKIHENIVADDYAGEMEAVRPPVDQRWTENGPVPAFLTGEEPDEPRRSRRAFYLMGAALVVVIGAIGATFAYRSGVVGSHDIPTIRAATAPTRVQPEKTDDAPAQAASVLDKGGDKTTASRVVNNTEQPVDLTQAARTQRATQPPGTTASPNLPEPRRVRTVTVRPDGTIASADPTPTAPAVSAAPVTAAASTPAVTPPAPRANPVTAAASGASPTTATTAATATPAAPPPRQVPRPTARGADPQAAAAQGDAPMNINDLAGRSAAPAATPRPARVAAAKPVDATDPSPTASTGGSGGFGVQLAAPGSEQEARDAVNRLQQKFASELGGTRLGWHKADSNGRTVYRVRANGLSKDDATSLCSKLQAGGGSCFVARN